MLITRPQTRCADGTPRWMGALVCAFGLGTGPICELAEQPQNSADHRGSWNAFRHPSAG